MKRFTLLLFVLTLTLCGVKAQEKNNFKTYKLDNGLTVILDKDASQTQVVGIVAANVGSQDEEEDATGLAHYLEHMLFKGTQKLGTSDWEKEKPLIEEIYTLYDKLQAAKTQEEIQKINEEINVVSQKASKYAIPNELSKLVEQMGGVGLNASTSFDVTEYHNIFPPNQLERWLDLYAHRFEEPVFRLFQTELEAVYEEKNRSEDNPSNAYSRELLKNIFKNHPYSRPVLGYTEHLRRPNISRMRTFFEKWYVPDNMVLILSGNFDMQQAEKMITEKFGKWENKTAPQRTLPKIQAFKGKQKVKVKLTPYLKAELVYNDSPDSEQDELAMDVVAELLSNSSQTGLLNKLSLDGEVLYAVATNEKLKDGSIFSISFAPVFDINQRRQMSFKSAESLIEDQVAKLKKGEYEDWLLEQVKVNMADEYEMAMEAPMVRARILLDAFVNGKNPQSIFNYKKDLSKINKDVVSNAVKKYIGKDYLAFYSYKGEADKEKIQKPKIDPIKPEKHQPSEYAQYFLKLPATEATHKFVDLANDSKVVAFQDKVKLHYVPNKRNDVFSMQVVFNAGKKKIPMLGYAISLMNNAGVMAQYKPDELRKEFGKLGVTYSFYANDYNTFIEMQGNETNLAQACQLLSRLMILPKIEDKALDRIIGSEYQNRMISKDMQTAQVAALREYIQYKDKSDYIDRISLNDLISVSPTQLTGKLNEAFSYNADIYYYGKMPIQQVHEALKQNLAFAANRKDGGKPEQKTVEKYNENTIFVVNNSKASQSNIFIFINGQPVSLEETPLVYAFNQYFSGGFTGLMMKEIREFRSLAYTAGANITTPLLPTWNSNFMGSIGTQGDKTVEAIEVTTNLIKDMPEYPERIENIKDYLVNSSFLTRPSDRNISYTIERWKQKGYTEDPTKKNLPVYKQMQFDEMVAFYKKHLQGKPYVIGIVGPSKKIDTDALEKFGKIVKLSANKLFSDK